MPTPKRPPKSGKKDPVQMALRKNKKEWSNGVSRFVDKIFEFKNSVNGRGSPELSIQPSRISEPLPQELGSVLSQLASEFQQITSGVNSIIQQQADYSQRRQKPKPKRPKGQPDQQLQVPEQSTASEPSPQEQVVQQLSQLAMEEYLMKKYATNRASRGWEYLKSILPFREKFNKERITLLSSAASLFYAILDFENDILTIGTESIPTAVSKYQIVRYHLDVLKMAVEQVSQSVSEQTPAITPGVKAPILTEDRLETPSSDQFDEQAFINDIKRVIHNVFMTWPDEAIKEDKETTEIHTMLDRFKSQALHPHEKHRIRNEIMKRYEAWIKRLQELHGSDEVNKVIHRRAFLETEALIKLAHNPVSRFLRRQWMKVRKTNRTALHRLKIASYLDKIKKLLKSIMDDLESGLNIQSLLAKIEEIGTEFENLKSPLSILNVIYRERFYNEQRKRLKDRKDDPLQDWLMKRKVRKELQQDLF